MKQYSFKIVNAMDIFKLVRLYKSIPKEMLKTVFLKDFYFSDFVDLFKENDIYVCYDEKNKPISMYWFNGYEANACRVHFLLIEAVSVRIIKKLADHALNYHLDNMVKTITCIIPCGNTKIFRFAKILGFKFFEEMAGFYDESAGIFGFLTKN